MTEADFALILGPYGVVVLLLSSTIHLYRENTALRSQSMDLLKKYQDRDDEERKLRNDETRKRAEEERWRSDQETRRSGEETRRAGEESQRSQDETRRQENQP